MGIGLVFLVRGDSGLVVLAYWMDCIVLYGSYCIGWIVSENTGFYVLSGYFLDETDGTDGIDGALVVWGWDGPTLSGAGTGASPFSPEQERHHWLLKGGGMW